MLASSVHALQAVGVTWHVTVETVARTYGIRQ